MLKYRILVMRLVANHFSRVSRLGPIGSIVSAMAKLKPNILWLQPDHSCELALTDDSWSHQHIHRSADGSTITVKAGNKRYALSSSTESEVEASRRKTSEAQLYKKYR